MKTINEIFATNPELLNTPEVKELVAQFKIQFDYYKDRYNNYWNAVTTQTMSSEMFVIDGKPCKEALEKINQISFEEF